MDALSQRSELLVELRDAGQIFLEGSRDIEIGQDSDQFNNYRICQMVPEESPHKLGHTIINQLIDMPTTVERASALNQPVFNWNGSIKDPIVSKTGNKLVNVSECFPPSLTLLALDYVGKGYGSGGTIYDQFVKKVGALFYAEATPRDFQIDANRQGVGLYFRDPEQESLETEDYIVKSSLFFDQMQHGVLPGLDIHDIAHHASQLGVYGDYYRWLASNTSEEVLYNPINGRKKMLIDLVLNTSLEHGVVKDEDSVQSFGCLNWQSPRKSILASGVSNRSEYRINDYPYGAKDFNQWSAIRAIASIHRGQLQAEAVLSTKLHWMESLGYGLDSELLSIVRPFQTYDYSVYPFDTASKATIRVPGSPEELFDNCRQLINTEFED